MILPIDRDRGLFELVCDECGREVRSHADVGGKLTIPDGWRLGDDRLLTCSRECDARLLQWAKLLCVAP